MGEPNAAPAPSSQPVALTPQQAEILLKADLANLARKVQQGKTLSAAERNLVQSILGGGDTSSANYADNQVELAKILNCDRKTIQRYRKLPGNPGARADGRYDVNAWRTFMARRRGDDTGAGDETSERLRNILLRNEKLEAELAITRKQWIPVEDVEKIGGELGAAIRKVVTQIHLCAPSVVGLSVPDAEARLKEIEDEILEQLHTLGERLGACKHAASPR